MTIIESIINFFQMNLFLIGEYEVSPLVLMYIPFTFLIAHLLRKKVIIFFKAKFKHAVTLKLEHQKQSKLETYVNFITYIFCVYTLLLIINIGFKEYRDFYLLFSPILKFNFISLGSFKLSLLLIGQLTIVWMFAKELNLWLYQFFMESLNKRYSDDEGSKDSIIKIINYILFSVWLLIGVQVVDLDISFLLAGSAVLGIGIGFGLQNMASNFVSGIVILFEKPIKKEDLIEVDGILGRVHEISFRSTIIRTRDNITIIVPNSKIIAENVTNWSHGEKITRIHIPIGVSYSSDLQLAKNIILDIAKVHKSITSRPPPKVLLDSFGDNAVNLILNIWTVFPEQDKYIISEILFEVFGQFGKAGIQIPFPQRDIHIVSDETKN